MTKSRGIGKGGKRPNAGRPQGLRKLLRFSEQDARSLHQLTKHYRTLLDRPTLTQEEVVLRLVNRDWEDILKAYEPVEMAQEPYIL